MMGEVIRVSGRAPDVGEFLREAMLSQRFADVALCCPGGQRFLAHRLVLSAASPYLQEVLLAHGKSAGLCEPITVILAEVESPELAAILGLVYTGSAAVPRTRLEAFLRAAKALHIQLPPLPEMMTTYLEDCKPEDIKDLKVNSKYLECEQYPSYNRWFETQEAIFNEYEDCDTQLPHTKLNQSTESLKMHPQDLKVYQSPTKDFESRQSRSKQLVSLSRQNSYSRCPNLKHDLTATREIESDEKMSEIQDSPKTSSKMDHEASAENPVRIPGGSRHSELEMRLQTSGFEDNRTRFDRDLKDDSVNLSIRRPFVSEEDLPRVDESVHLSLMKNLSAPDQIDGNRFPIPSSSPRMNPDRNYEAPSKILESLFDLRVPSLHPAVPGQPETAEKLGYGQIGQDLTCRENCCKWRPPRRHVANHVTASPWRQLVRPHHSPKVQPIILQNHPDHCEPSGRLQQLLSTEVSRTEVIPAPMPSPATDQLSRSSGNSGSFHGFEVPTSAEVPFPSEVETIRTKERRLQEFYRAQMLFPGPQPVRPLPVNFGPAPNFFRNQNTAPPPPPPLPPLPPSVQSAAQIHHNGGLHHQSNGQVHLQSIPMHPNSVQIGQTCPQFCAKPELSHPISRLCDSTKSAELFSSNLDTKLEEDGQTLGEKIGPCLMQSDSNNNNASMNDAIQNRNEGITDDHRCEQCGKSFVTRASLKVHARTHSGEKPFQCSDCGKQFSQLRNYKYHRSVHEGTREFAATCPECGKYFNDRGYLSSHMKIHRNRKEYACGECGKSFNQRVAYNMHVRIHTGVKPHQCEQCGKAFSRKMLLKQHLRTHSGERPYQCQVCHKAFADRSNMTLHTRLHSGLKPYQCTLCSKAFTKKHHLKTHLNYHTGTKPYSCPNCGLRFSQSSNMRTHYKKCSVNNPNGVQMNPNGRPDRQSSRDSEGGNLIGVNPRTPSAALTPPNSDQESSILTPIPRPLSMDVTKT